MNAQTGNDSNNGSSSSRPVKSLSRALQLVASKSRPLTSNLIVNLSGTFTQEQLKVRNSHRGTSDDVRVIFRGDSDGSTRLLSGKELNFVKVSSLSESHPARQLAQETGTSISNLWAAEPPSTFPSNDSALRWPDKDCRDFENYKSPPTLSLNGKVMTRSREPNLLPPTASTDSDSMGEVRDTWLRTQQANNQGIVKYKSSNTASISKASNDSWNSGSVVVHLFPMVDWYDTRVQVGTRSSNGNQFATITNQKAPGDPNEGNKFRIVKEARYYLEGAIEYLDDEWEYHVSLGEVVSESRGWTLLYPPAGVDMENVQAVLSLTKNPLIDIEGSNLHVSFENLVLEGSTRCLAIVFAYFIDFYKCSFINAGHDAVKAYGQKLTFRDCIFEGTGGSGLQLSDDRDIDTDGKGFLLLESGIAVTDSLISDFASTCRHYSEGVHLGGFGSIVSNNHFRSSNMAAIDVVGGGFHILHNVFSHVSDGSYDDGAIHWVANSPMERGTEVAFNVFFRNGVSYEPCNAETSCYQADIYMDDMAGAMTIHGNVLIKDKVLQSKPTNSNFDPIQWVGIFFNGGADVLIYENAYLPPEDDSTNDAIFNNRAAFFEQSCGGTIWPDSTSCGNTGLCSPDIFYKEMRLFGYTQDPWASAFPELLLYDATPDPGSDYYCADRRDCPVASWNNTVVCNSGIGTNRLLSNRAIWPSDSESYLNDEAVEGKTVPARSRALIENGNKGGGAFSIGNIDAIESAGIAAVLAFAKSVASAGEAQEPECNEGSRRGAARSDLAGRNNNPCTNSWSLVGLQSCDPCAGINCAPRDLPANGQCSCSGPPSPTMQPAPPTPTPTNAPNGIDTPSPTISPTDANDDTNDDDGDNDENCIDSSSIFKINGKRRTCNNLHFKKYEKKCKKTKFSTLCPVVCGFCSGSYACIDSKGKFKVNGVKKRCKTLSTEDCSKSWISRWCPVSCNDSDICG